MPLRGFGTNGFQGDRAAILSKKVLQMKPLWTPWHEPRIKNLLDIFGPLGEFL